MSEAVESRTVGDYTIDEVLQEIRRSDADLVLTGTSSILAMLGSAMLEALGMKPEGRAEVTATIDDTTEIAIRWPG
jgi:nucleotide-binding universal stress UspA family protein